MNLKPILKTASVFLIALFISSTVKAQVWNTVGNGLTTFATQGNNAIDGYPTISTFDTSGVFVVSNYKNGPGSVWSNFLLEKWDGVVWKKINIPIGITPATLAAIGSNIYISSFNALWQFDGANWTNISPAGFTGNIFTLEVVNGELLCGGNFTANGGIDKLMRFDGVSFYSYPPIGWIYGILDILYSNNELYITSITVNPMPIDSTFLKLNALNIWEGPANFFQGTGGTSSSLRMMGYQNDIYFNENSNALFKLTQDSILVIATATHTIAHSLEFKGDLYMNGPFGTPTSLSKFNSGVLSPITSSPNDISQVAKFQNELFAFARHQLIMDSIVYNRAFRTDGASSMLHGSIYADINANCIFDTTENTLNNVVVKVDGVIHNNSNLVGQYSLSLPSGPHTIDTAYLPLLVAKNVTQSCAVANPIVLAVNSSTKVDIALKSNTANDAMVKTTTSLGWRLRHGFTELVRVEVSNAGNNVLNNIELKIDVPSSLGITTTFPAPASQSGNLLTFNISQLNSLQTFIAELYVHVDTANNSILDTLQFVTWLNLPITDVDTSDNSDTLVVVVLGACDPNDKTANAEYISPTTKRIDYHINFQNTGTDTAYKVVVVDTLNTSLALTNVVINSASHPYNFSVVNNILVWEFDNILLPDSGADYQGSQGYVNFSTGINPALGLGDSVTNDADIYFDFQWPIITNTAKTTIVNNISVLEQTLPERVLEVYPNPARDVIRIKNISVSDLRIQITNTNGQIIYAFTLKPSEELNYECSNLPAGMYILSTQFESYKILITD